MTNDLKDRHVSASAVSAEAKFIATFNLRHFKSADLAPWDLTAIHPQQFLANLFQERPDIVRLKLKEQAERRKIDVTALLGHLRLSVPQFVDLLQA